MNIQQLGNNNSLQQLSQVKKQTEVSKSGQTAQQTQQQNTSEKIVDEYIHQEPEKSAGIYDENGKLKNSENSSTMTIKANEGKLSEAGAGAGVGGGAPVSSSSESTDDDDDSELEELEQQQAQLRQKLNTESDEQVKAELRTELQTIENQIMQLKLK